MLNKSLFYTILFFSLFSSTYTFAMNDSALKTKWGYEGEAGPSHWAQLNPHFAVCAVGKLQSPIDISPKIMDQTSKLDIHYTPTSMVIVKDGSTSLMIGEEQTIINDGHSIQLNFSEEGVPESITFNQDEYKLVQFHLHTPSENKLNGQSFPAEIHFVHQGKDGTLAVIGVLIKAGEENAELQKIIDHLPKEKNKALKISEENISPVNLLPSDQTHYDFKGSLTTPPCSEAVQWVVMKNSITASSQQIAQLKAATQGNNARPIQPRHKRDIFFSE